MVHLPGPFFSPPSGTFQTTLRLFVKSLLLQSWWSFCFVPEYYPATLRRPLVYPDLLFLLCFPFARSWQRCNYFQSYEQWLKIWFSFSKQGNSTQKRVTLKCVGLWLLEEICVYLLLPGILRPRLFSRLFASWECGTKIPVASVGKMLKRGC